MNCVKSCHVPWIDWSNHGRSITPGQAGLVTVRFEATFFFLFGGSSSFPPKIRIWLSLSYLFFSLLWNLILSNKKVIRYFNEKKYLMAFISFFCFFLENEDSILIARAWNLLEIFTYENTTDPANRDTKFVSYTIHVRFMYVAVYDPFFMRLCATISPWLTGPLMRIIFRGQSVGLWPSTCTCKRVVLMAS